MEMRGCKTQDHGYIIIKHKTDEKVLLRDVAGKVTPVVINYIKVHIAHAIKYYSTVTLYTAM